MEPRNSCLALHPGLRRFREELEAEGVEAVACMGDASLGLMRITADTVTAVAFLRRELEDIGVVANHAKTVVLPPKNVRPEVVLSWKVLMSASQTKEERVSRSERTNV